MPFRTITTKQLDTITGGETLAEIKQASLQCQRLATDLHEMDVRAGVDRNSAFSDFQSRLRQCSTVAINKVLKPTPQ